MKNKRMLDSTEPGRRYSSGLGTVFLCLVLFFSGITSPGVAQADPLREAAESFLELLDAGSYQQAWWEGSELLHLTTNLDQWVGKKRVQRDLLGSFEERSVRTFVERESLPGFPDGVYGVLVTECRFEEKQRGVEVIALGRDPYGSWKVISYDLR